jgi:probable phosphoglycerate mutase
MISSAITRNAAARDGLFDGETDRGKGVRVHVPDLLERGRVPSSDLRSMVEARYGRPPEVHLMPPRSTTRKPPPATVVLFVRHGQTPTTGSTLPGRARGLHLADKGEAQAAVAATRIKRLKKVDAIFASPLERTRETAAPIGRACRRAVRIDKGLLECDFGDWTGRKLNDLRKLPEWGAVQRSPSSFRFPNGESFTEMQTRMVSAVERLVARHRGGVIVAVSHADPIKAAVAHAMGVHLDLFQRIVISPCSISAVLYSAGGPTVLTVNSTGDDLSSLAPS